MQLIFTLILAASFLVFSEESPENAGRNPQNTVYDETNSGEGLGEPGSENKVSQVSEFEERQKAIDRDLQYTVYDQAISDGDTEEPDSVKDEPNQASEFKEEQRAIVRDLQYTVYDEVVAVGDLEEPDSAKDEPSQASEFKEEQKAVTRDLQYTVYDGAVADENLAKSGNTKNEPSDETKPKDAAKTEKVTIIEQATVEEKMTDFSFIALVVLVVLLFLSVLTNIILLRWISKDKTQSADFPTDTLDQLSDLLINLKQIKDDTQRQSTRGAENATTWNQQVLDVVTEKYDAILESFSSIQKEVDNKDRELEKLRRGYDLQIIKKFAIRIIKIFDMCQDIMSYDNVSDDTKKEIDFIAGGISDLISELGIKTIHFDSGVLIKGKKSDKRECVPGEFVPPINEWLKEKTDDENKAFQIIETVREGFYIDAQIKEVLRYPKIRVFIKE